MLFAIPTAALIWLGANFGLGFALGFNGFLIILGVFAAVALLFPRFFPSFIGKVWEWLSDLW